MGTKAQILHGHFVLEVGNNFSTNANDTPLKHWNQKKYKPTLSVSCHMWPLKSPFNTYTVFSSSKFTGKLYFMKLIHVTNWN